MTFKSAATSGAVALGLALALILWPDGRLAAQLDQAERIGSPALILKAGADGAPRAYRDLSGTDQAKAIDVLKGQRLLIYNLSDQGLYLKEHHGGDSPVVFASKAIFIPEKSITTVTIQAWSNTASGPVDLCMQWAGDYPDGACHMNTPGPTVQTYP